MKPVQSGMALLAAFFFFSHTLSAVNPKFFIAFTDRNANPYSLSSPADFLSQRAIDRRTRQHISLTENDLPVNPDYVDSVIAKGAIVFARLKWFNGVIVQCDSSTLNSILSLPFVQNAVKVFRHRSGYSSHPKFESEFTPLAQDHGIMRVANYDYGDAFNQIHLMNGEYLHQKGFKGEGMQIAVLDAGFNSADLLPALDSLFTENRVLGTWDFVRDTSLVFDQDAHGSEVLSDISAIFPGQMVGTAPRASVYLIRTEDAPNEHLIEEYNWAAGAEFADSAGADLISSSLGYSLFDDPSMDHTYADMNGHTCPSTRAANFAAAKGILVLVSAGNLGVDPWHYISAPSDADSALSIGAVDEFGYKAAFSSWGPSSDGDIKPNVAAKGAQATISYTDGSIGLANGTSFSCPILAGAAACLWQAHPDKTNMEVFRAIEQSANYHLQPGDSLGYGIPNFIRADQLLQGALNGEPATDELLSVYPNPFRENLTLKFYSISDQEIHVLVSDEPGRIVLEEEVFTGSRYITTIDLNRLSSLANGMYVLKIESSGKTFEGKLIKY